MRAFLFVLSSFSGLATNAVAIEFFTDSNAFHASPTPLTTIDFESIAPDRSFAWNISEDISANVSLEGWRFNVLSANFVNPNYPGSPSDFLLHDYVDRGFAMNFSKGIDRLGMRIAMARIDPHSNGELELRLFSGDDLIDARHARVTHVATFDSFIGYAGITSVTRLEIGIVNSETHTVAIDDLSFHFVPEPSTASATLFSLLAFSVGHRLRKRYVEFQHHNFVNL